MTTTTLKKLVCPKCGTFWATLDTKDTPSISAKHVKIVTGRRKKLKDGDSLKCSSCSYEYTTWDIILAIANSNDYPGMKPGQKLPSATDKENGDGTTQVS